MGFNIPLIVLRIGLESDPADVTLSSLSTSFNDTLFEEGHFNGLLFVGYL